MGVVTCPLCGKTRSSNGYRYLSNGTKHAVTERKAMRAQMNQHLHAAHPEVGERERSLVTDRAVEDALQRRLM